MTKLDCVVRLIAEWQIDSARIPAADVAARDALLVETLRRAFLLSEGIAVYDEARDAALAVH